MKILIFGFGEMGKKLIDECITYDTTYEIQAIIDNYAKVENYCEIPVIKPDAICQYTYDVIWICTVYYNEIMEQLHSQYGIERSKMQFVEPVVPILENRLRKQYAGVQKDIKDKELIEVLNYLNNKPLRMYCYPFYEEYLYRKTEIQFDADAGLFFGIYENKKMYLARRFDTEQKARAYFNTVIMEQDSRSPHCYWNDENMQAVRGTAVDVGAAEGIFGLKIIEQLEHLYMIEMDEEWIEALKLTYAPYKEKVTIICKFVGNSDKENNVKLDTLFPYTNISCIKMDIEGAEVEALQGAQNILQRCNVEVVACTYHHKADNEIIKAFLENKGYFCKNSNGLVVCQGDWELEKNETGFRKALIFAHKREST